jgi:hypothetical protein
MAEEKSKAAKALQVLKDRRYTMPQVALHVYLIHGVTTSRSSLARILSGERTASAELEKALIKAARVMK